MNDRPAGEHDAGTAHGDVPFDRDDATRDLLRAADPARRLRPADPSALARLLEDTMRSDLDPGLDLGINPAVGSGPTTEHTPDRLEPRRRRGPLTWIAVAAAAAVVVTAGAGAVQRLVSGDDQAPPTAAPQRSAPASTGPSASTGTDTGTSTGPTGSPSGPTSTSSTDGSTAPVTTLALAPGALDARCAAPTAQLLRGFDTAFSATVTAIQGDRVVLQPTATFAGSVGDPVTVKAPSADFSRLVQTVHFEVGDRYLVSAYQGQLAVCGFTGRATSDLAGLYTEAFPR